MSRIRYLAESFFGKIWRFHKYYPLVTIICAKPIVDIEDVIVVFIIVPVVVRGFARFCQDPPWVMR